MLSGVFIFIAAIVAQIDATVTPLSGAPLKGQLVELSSDGATVNFNGEARKFTTQEFRKIEFATAGETPALPVEVELTDGSLVRCVQFTVAKSTASLRLHNGQTLAIPTASIRRVLLQPLTTDDDRSLWQELSTEKLDKDILIIRRDTKGARLDSFDGILHDITEENVALTFQDKDFTPSRSRVIGFSYFHPEGSEPKVSAVCNIIDDSGSTWRASSLELKDGTLQWTTPTSVTMKLPMPNVRQLDYAVGNLVYLSDLETEVEKWEPYIEPRIGRELLAPRYAPRRDESFDGGPLLLGGNAFKKGLALHSRTELVYRLKEPYSRLRGQAGLDDRVRDTEIQASVRLTISGDDKVLFDQIISVADGAIDLDLDVTGVRRLRILLDYGDDLDVADYLNLCEVRLTK